MIKTKQDLAGKYALREDKEVFELFAEKVKELGFSYCGTGAGAHSCPEVEAVDADLSDNTLTHCTQEYYEKEGYTKLTLEDFIDTSPKQTPVKTKVDYIKWDIPKLSTAISLVEDGEVFYYKATEGLKPFWVEVKAPNYQSVVANWEYFHKQLVTELTWEEELSQEYVVSFDEDKVVFRGVMDKKVFVEMCHTVSEANK